MRNTTNFNMDNNAPENILLGKLHEMIDKKFKRRVRGKKIAPVELKNAMSMWSIAKEFGETKPEEMVVLLKLLVDRGSVVTNLNDEIAHPFDAWFIPETEMIDEKAFKIYLTIKKILH